MTGLPIAVAGAIGLVAKATVVLSVALFLAWLARRGSAKTLHLLWTTTFAVLLVFPVLSPMAPAWMLPILPARTTTIEHHIPEATVSEPSATANRPNAIASRIPWRQSRPRTCRPPLGPMVRSR